MNIFGLAFLLLIHTIRMLLLSLLLSAVRRHQFKESFTGEKRSGDRKIFFDKQSSISPYALLLLILYFKSK